MSLTRSTPYEHTKGVRKYLPDSASLWQAGENIQKLFQRHYGFRIISYFR